MLQSLRFICFIVPDLDNDPDYAQDFKLVPESDDLVSGLSLHQFLYKISF